MKIRLYLKVSCAEIKFTQSCKHTAVLKEVNQGEKMRDTFMTASVCSSNHPTKACPDSWKATTLCSSLDRILLFFTLPENTHMQMCLILPG